MQVWVKGNGDSLRIPVLPESYSMKTSQGNVTVNINGLGDINLLGKRGLSELSFGSFFPMGYDASYCDCRSPVPRECVERLEKMKQGGTVKVLFTGIFVLTATIESFEWGESDATGDIYFTLEFKEYRHLSIPVSSLSQSAGVLSESSVMRSGEPDVASANTYTVMTGDCLSSIARKLTGSADWHALYEQNKELIGSNPNLIYAGQVLTIP